MVAALPEHLAEDINDVALWSAGELTELRALSEAQLAEPAALTKGDYLAVVGSIDTLARMALGMMQAAAGLANHPILGRLLGG